jgi:hypothetical protein
MISLSKQRNHFSTWIRLRDPKQKTNPDHLITKGRSRSETKNRGNGDNPRRKKKKK